MMVVFRVRRVGGDHDGSDGHDGKIGNRPFRAVFRRDQDPFARLDTAFHQHRGKPANIIGYFPPASPVPVTVTLFEQQLAVAALFDIVEKRFWQIGGLDVMRSFRPIFAHHSQPFRMPCCQSSSHIMKA